ncbi:MAG: dienelactone hydrolase family protein [Bacteroidales bacterium]|nr:dienelactone hydrolase family protein [Bacteroidales bacterium]
MKALLLLLVASLPLKLWPAVEPQMAVLASEQREGYTCQLVEYNVPDGDRVQSYLLVPDTATEKSPRPGLVLLHDHGARFDIGKEKLVRPLSDAPDYIKASAAEWVADGFDGVYFGDRLAREGFVVLVPDMLYWGSRSSAKCREWSRTRSTELKKEVYEGQRAVYDSLQRKGIVWAEKTLNEDAAAARLLASLPFVKAEETGCFGWSMGAHRAWLLAAFCDEVKSGVALCWMTLKRTQAQPPSASDYSMMIPALREQYDFPDIARSLAPKPFLFLSGTTDKLFPREATQEAFERMQAIYRENGATGALRTEFFEGGHHCGLREQQTIIHFFKHD